MWRGLDQDIGHGMRVLFGVGSLDASSFGSAAGLLLAAGLAASLVPAWRASRVDAMVALRAE